MLKKLALLLAIVMMFTCVSAFAEGGAPGETGDAPASDGAPAEGEGESSGESSGESAEPIGANQVMNVRAEGVDAEAAAAEEAFLKGNCEFAVIEADETTGQVKLSYIEGVTTILEVDGLKFKDLNKNGTLDVYEDWRAETDNRIADLIAQMSPKDEVGLLFCVNTQLADAREMVRKYALTCQLFNLNGTPITITNTLNNLQACAEAESLGVPMVFTSDREYNSFGGYIDKAHEGFGTANDPELAYELASFYGKAMTAIGIHVTFEPYAEEIGAQYGENPEYIAAIVHEEIKGLEENGLASCTKHWIGRGGDSAFGKARSQAQNFENWMVGWKAALSAGSEWVMTNCGGTGISNTVDVKWDKETMNYLRNEIDLGDGKKGFDGVVVTDWWALGGGPSNPGRMSGITAEGVDLSQQTIGWLYNEALANGTDMFGSGSMIDDYSTWENSPSSNYPQAIIDGLETGEVEKKNVDQAATRILRFKFNKGLFEDPYRDVQKAVEICASAEWAATATAETTTKDDEDLRAARNPAEVELTEKLQAKSAVLVKNDNNLLPLSKDAKIYLDADDATAKKAYAKYCEGEGATLVDEMDEADVIVGDFASINDATELFLDDAADAGKPIVISLNRTKPTQYILESADAVLYMSYSQAADHGSTEGGFLTGTASWVYADLIFGDREPGGVINKEIARDTVADNEQWKDLAGDQGASPYVRLMVQAVMEDDPNHASPNNWGDPLITYHFGMSYGKTPEFKYSCLILPLNQKTEEVESGSSTTTQTTVWTEAKAGEPFTIYALLRNTGDGDGLTTAEATVNGDVVAKKIMTVDAGSWRVVQMDITIAEPGDYTVAIGDAAGTISIAE